MPKLMKKRNVYNNIELLEYIHEHLSVNDNIPRELLSDYNDFLKIISDNIGRAQRIEKLKAYRRMLFIGVLAGIIVLFISDVLLVNVDLAPYAGAVAVAFWLGVAAVCVPYVERTKTQQILRILVVAVAIAFAMLGDDLMAVVYETNKPVIYGLSAAMLFLSMVDYGIKR